MELIDGAIYTTKVGLFVRKYGEVSSYRDTGLRILHPNSHVYYDQYADGWNIFI